MHRPPLAALVLALAFLALPLSATGAEPPPRFLAHPPDHPIHHHINRITITPDSLDTGWADLYQCHENMDALGATQIVFGKGRIRNLEVVATKNIARARVEGARVLLDGVKKGAMVCIRAQSRALSRDGSGRWVLRNGPFLRRFLDSYFPMHVTLEVRFPPGRLSFLSMRPHPRPGLTVQRARGRVTVEAWFDGVLRTRLRFRAPDTDSSS